MIAASAPTEAAMAEPQDAIAPVAADMVRVGSCAAVGEAGLTAARLEDVELVMLRHGEGIAVFQGRCPHQGTLLAEGALGQGVLTCRGHGWRFDGDTGASLNMPAVCLRRFRSAQAGDDVLVDRAEVLAWKRATDGHAHPEPASAARPLNALPGPHGIPLLGNYLQMHKDQIHTDMEHWAETFGPIYRINLAGRDAVVLSEGEWIDRILHNRPDTFRRASAIETLSREVGTVGAFSAEGETWRRHRRPVVQALDAHHLRAFLPTLVNVTRRLQRRWEQAAAEGRPVHAQHDLMQYAVDVTTNLAFGYDMNTLEGRGGEVQHHLERILPKINRRLNAPFPYWHYIRLPADRAFDKSVAAVREAIGCMIGAARERLAQSPELAAHPRNFLEAMVAAQARGEASLSDDEIFSNAFTLLLAGEDTTANTISWVLHFMCRHADVQRRMQDEVAAVLGDAAVLTDLREAAQLAYLDAVVHESLRLKPVAPLFYMEPNEDVVVAGYQIPKGTLIVLVTRPNTLRDSSFADATAFRPERWLETSAAALHRNGFVPFGSGPRLCPGRSLALLEAKAALSMVCQRFNVRQAPATGPVSEGFAFTMMPTGLRLDLEPRRTSG
jgi:cytochrome P450/nitrite reductase/ring-hydroxylating ferredoxin subunit